MISEPNFIDLWRYINAVAYLFWSHLESMNKDTLYVVYFTLLKKYFQYLKNIKMSHLCLLIGCWCGNRTRAQENRRRLVRIHLTVVLILSESGNISLKHVVKY
jgi:hypothetical protein